LSYLDARQGRAYLWICDIDVPAGAIARLALLQQR